MMRRFSSHSLSCVACRVSDATRRRTTHHAPRAVLLSRFALLPLVLGAVLVGGPAFAQGTIDRNHVPSDERVDLFERRQTDLDGNVIRTTVFNFGQTGRTSETPGDGIPYEWPRNTRRNYIALTGLFAFGFQRFDHVLHGALPAFCFCLLPRDYTAAQQRQVRR